MRVPPRPPSLTALGSASYGVGRLLVWVMSLFPVLISLMLGLGLVLPATRHEASRLLLEDHLVENLTVVGYLAGCALAVGMALRVRSRGRARAFAGWLVVAVVCFGLAGEEISWGERIWQFRSPEWQRVNVQHETSVHNLPGLHELGGWFPLVFTSAALVAIVTHTRKRKETSGVPTLLLPYCLVIVLLATCDRYDDRAVGIQVSVMFGTIIGQLQELVEMLFSFAIPYGIWLAARRDGRREVPGS